MKAVLATSTGVRIAGGIGTEVHKFPDGELYVRIMGDLEGEDVAIIGNSYPDGGIIELLLLMDAVRGLKPSSIKLIIPYLGYGRQDRIFQKGEALSARAICGSLRSADAVALIDPHSPLVKNFFGCRVEELSAIPLLARWMEGRVDLIVAPDEGSARRAEMAAKEIGVEFVVMHKERKTAYDVEVNVEEKDLKGQSIGVVDDIVSTGGTMIKACNALREREASEIYLACTHGIFLENSFGKLRELCNGIATTDSLKENLRRKREEGEMEVLPLAPLILSYLKKSDE